jgi:hypothetical protein
MIYRTYNFNESFSNANGNGKLQMTLRELGKLLNNHREEVIVAIRSAGVDVKDNANRKELIKVILLNKRNKEMIYNLSTLIYASSYFDGNSYFSAEGDEESGDKPKEKGKFLSAITNFFKKRKEIRADKIAKGEPTFWQKITGFLDKNKETIGTIGGSLYQGLQNSKDAGNIVQQELQAELDEKERKAKNQRYIVIGLGVVVIGLVAYMYMKKKK